MDNSVLLLLQGALGLLFVVLTMHRRTDAWWLLAAVFVAVAGVVRFSLRVDTIRDFVPYFRSFEQVKQGVVPTELWFEPYRLGLWKAILLLGDRGSDTQIAIAYFFHFAVITAFFVWLAYLESISFVAKVILFFAFYPPMAFAWINAGMAYAVACFLFIAVSSRSKWNVLHFTPIMFHASVLPFVAVMKSLAFRPVFRAVVIIITVGVVFLLSESSYAQYVGGKLDHYAETGDERTSQLLLLFQVANILTFAALAVLSQEFRRNFALWVLMATCTAMYLVNPVVGVRLFPLVLIACLVQRVTFPRYRHLVFLISVAYAPVYFVRFDQIIVAM